METNVQTACSEPKPDRVKRDIWRHQAGIDAYARALISLLVSFGSDNLAFSMIVNALEFDQYIPAKINSFERVVFK